MIKKILLIISAVTLYFIPGKMIYSQKATLVANNDLSSNQVIVNKNQKVSKTKTINVPKIVDTKGTDIFYPDHKLPIKTNNILLVGSGVMIMWGIVMLQIDSFFNLIKAGLSKLGTNLYLLKFINKIL